ncbi:hypothetical protein Tco_1203212 [Tanacetum coccineum]
MVGLSFRMFKGDRIRVRIRGILLREMVLQYHDVAMMLVTTSSRQMLTYCHEHEIHNEVQKANVIDSNSVDVGNSNVIPYEQYLWVDNISVVPSCASSALNDVYDQRTKTALGAQNAFHLKQAKKAQLALFSDIHDAFTIAKNCIADLESKNFNLRNKIQNDDHDSMIKHFSKLEVEHFNLQLKYQNLKERFGNKKPVTSSDAPSFDSLFVIGKLNEQIQSRGNTIHELKEKISRLTKKNSDADPIFDLKALVSQNKDLTAKLNALHDLNERFREENAKVKQHYKELYDSIKITRAKTTDQNNSLLSEIEDLKAQLKDKSKCVTIPDSKPKVLAPSRYPIDVEPIPPRLKKNREVHLHYIKHLKENVETLREIVEDAKVERPLDTSLASACQPCETSTHNTPPQVEHQKINSTNAPGIPSTGVNGASAASRSKPRSNTKKDRTLPAKSALKQVEAHSRMNKSNEKQKNHVDSSISYKRTVINSNSNTSCKTCNKCLISVNHDQCVVRSGMFVKQSPATKVWRVKQVKQVWKATGKLFTTIGHQWRPTGRLLPLGDQWPLTRNTPPKVLPTKQWKPTGRLLPLRRQCPLVRSTALKSDCMPADPQETIAPVVQIVLWVYYVEGLDHLSLSVNFGVSDLEVALESTTCFVQDLELWCRLIKGSHASRTKSWVMAFICLESLNLAPLNDLARKDLVRGLPRLKFKRIISHTIPPAPAPAPQAPVNPTGPSVSIPIDQEAPSGSHSPSSSDHQSSSVHQGVATEHSFEVNPFTADDPEPFVNVFALDHNSEASSSGVIARTESNQTTQPHEHLRNGLSPTLLIILLGTLLDRYPLGSSLLQMICGASTIQYCPKSNRKTSNLLLLKTAGFNPCKMKSMNLINWTYGN